MIPGDSLARSDRVVTGLRGPGASVAAEVRYLRGLSPIFMKMLQILKYRFRKERLSFTEDLISNERELSVIEVPPEKIAELLAEGRIDELAELLVTAGREDDANRTITEGII
ncbi:hypothetical protein FIBSPDRAFT_901915 [Athelia psychrophila]|uniref:Uncharacterized protein n=1 Tax=Athelia psychrophila TaxID=1759441 RepID=A0A165WES0_9AGAM|nr:hypothetical protein FIBSPDRAFT_901915 [Fibularhizoctonia sp. CBS 109695]